MELPAGLSGDAGARAPWRVDVGRRGPLPGPRRPAALSQSGVQQAELVARRLADRESRRAAAGAGMATRSASGTRRSPARDPDGAANRRAAARHRPASDSRPDRDRARASGRACQRPRSTRAGRPNWPPGAASPVDTMRPGARPWPLRRSRVAGAVQRAARANSTAAEVDRGEPWALLVAHDGIFRLLLITLFGLPLEHFWSFPFNLCAISVMGIRDGVSRAACPQPCRPAPPTGPFGARPGSGGALAVGWAPEARSAQQQAQQAHAHPAIRAYQGAEHRLVWPAAGVGRLDLGQRNQLQVATRDGHELR